MATAMGAAADTILDGAEHAFEDGFAGEQPIVRIAGSANDRRMVRRRGNQEQGRALEQLGHAIEYLMDSRIFTRNEEEARGDEDAVQILMQMSRVVFSECPEVISIKRRLKRWFWRHKAAWGFDRRRRNPESEG